jgi:hypothetical protein
MEQIISFLVAGPNLPFLIAACLVAAIAILELLSSLVGHSHIMLDSDIDFTADLNGNGIPDYLEMDSAGLFGWLNPGHVPSIVFLLMFAGVFALFGFTGQWVFQGLTGMLIPMLVAGPIAATATLPVVRQASIVIVKILPQDETSAISTESLIGRIGVVNVGPISDKEWGFARFTDQYGTDHQLLVRNEGNEYIANGESVVLLEIASEASDGFVVRKSLI